MFFVRKRELLRGPLSVPSSLSPTYSSFLSSSANSPIRASGFLTSVRWSAAKFASPQLHAWGVLGEGRASGTSDVTTLRDRVTLGSHVPARVNTRPSVIDSATASIVSASASELSTTIRAHAQPRVYSFVKSAGVSITDAVDSKSMVDSVIASLRNTVRLSSRMRMRSVDTTVLEDGDHDGDHDHDSSGSGSGSGSRSGGDNDGYSRSHGYHRDGSRAYGRGGFGEWLRGLAQRLRQRRYVRRRRFIRSSDIDGSENMGGLLAWMSRLFRRHGPSFGKHQVSRHFREQMASRFRFWMIRPRFVYIGGVRHNFAISDLLGHTSFILMAISFALTDVVWLRSLALLAAGFMMVFNYWHPHSRVMWLPLKWNALIALTNAAQLIVLLDERWRASRLSKDAENLYERVFMPCGMKKVDFMKLFTAGEVNEYDKGDTLTAEGTHNNHVRLVMQGAADVMVRDRTVYRLTEGQFIGEMGLHVGLRISQPVKSSASVVVTEPGTQCLVWTRGALIDVLEQNRDLAPAFQSAISSDLVRKALNSDDPRFFDEVQQNSREFKRKKIPLTEEEAKAKARQRMVEKDFDMYRRLLETVLQDGRVTAHERSTLKRYCSVHYIPPAVHHKILGELGWTTSQYLRGSNPEVAAQWQRQQDHQVDVHHVAGRTLTDNGGSGKRGDGKGQGSRESTAAASRARMLNTLRKISVNSAAHANPDIINSSSSSSEAQMLIGSAE